MTLIELVIMLSLFMSLLFYVSYQWLARLQANRRNAEELKRFRNMLQSSQYWRGRRLQAFYHRFYMLLIRLPLLSAYLRRIRKRLAGIHSYDEQTLRRETIKITLATLSITVTGAMLIMLMSQDFTYLFIILLGTLVVNSTMLDLFINRVENRLYRQFHHMLADVRHRYHHHGMVSEAVAEAAESASYEASLHGKRIYEILIAKDAQHQLEAYYESAPNRFLKGFAGISFLIQEFGDKRVKNGSMYLNGLSNLAHEVQMEMLKREKLTHKFRNLSLIALLPVLFTNPIEDWAVGHFPAMADFYSSALGFLTKLILFGIILSCYLSVRKMEQQSERSEAVQQKWRPWSRLLQVKPLAWLVDRLIPGAHTHVHFKEKSLMKDADSVLSMREFYMQRIVLSIGCFLLATAIFMSMHAITIRQTLYAPSKDPTLFSHYSSEQQERGMQLSAFDRTVIQEVRDTRDGLLSHIMTKVKEEDPAYAADPVLLNETAMRIYNKVQILNREYLKWWEILLALALGWTGYKLPVGGLMLKKRWRLMDRQLEVDQLLAIIAILSEMERISVENILEWMERFALIYKRPIQTTLMNYESGPVQALEQLKEEVPFPPFARIVDKLILSVEKIPIREAFDDLESERTYYREQRKLEQDRVIDAKVSWGTMFGFTPIYAVVFLYVVIPFLYMSFKQLNGFYEQIAKLL